MIHLILLRLDNFLEIDCVGEKFEDILSREDGESDIDREEIEEGREAFSLITRSGKQLLEDKTE